MKSINAILVFAFVAAAVTLLVGLSLYFDRVTGVYKEETQSQIYDTSRQYQQGINRDIARYCRQWREAEGPGKKAVADLIRSTADTYQGEYTSTNQQCLSEIGEF